MTTHALLSVVGLEKIYRKQAEEIRVLRGIDLDVQEGEFLSIVGASGSGKSTLLHLMGTLDKPDRGAIYLQGCRIDDRPSVERDQLRNKTFGFIFQFYHLLPELSTLENVLVPQMIHHGFFSWFGSRRALRKRAMELLDRVGLSHRLKHRPQELSGGELQRAAIARALINRPRVLLADEPTGNLDSANGSHIMALLRDLNRNANLTVVMVTHNQELAHHTDRVVRMTDGKLEVEHSAPSSYVTAGLVG